MIYKICATALPLAIMIKNADASVDPDAEPQRAQFELNDYVPKRAKPSPERLGKPMPLKARGFLSELLGNDGYSDHLDANIHAKGEQWNSLAPLIFEMRINVLQKGDTEEATRQLNRIERRIDKGAYVQHDMLKYCVQQEFTTMLWYYKNYTANGHDVVISNLTEMQNYLTAAQKQVEKKYKKICKKIYTKGIPSITDALKRNDKQEAERLKTALFNYMKTKLYKYQYKHNKLRVEKAIEETQQKFERKQIKYLLKGQGQSDQDRFEKGYQMLMNDLKVKNFEQDAQTLALYNVVVKLLEEASAESGEEFHKNLAKFKRNVTSAQRKHLRRQNALPSVIEEMSNGSGSGSGTGSQNGNTSSGSEQKQDD